MSKYNIDNDNTAVVDKIKHQTMSNRKAQTSVEEGR